MKIERKLDYETQTLVDISALNNGFHYGVCEDVVFELISSLLLLQLPPSQAAAAADWQAGRLNF